MIVCPVCGLMPSCPELVRTTSCRCGRLYATIDSVWFIYSRAQKLSLKVFKGVVLFQGIPYSLLPVPESEREATFIQAVRYALTEEIMTS